MKKAILILGIAVLSAVAVTSCSNSNTKAPAAQSSTTEKAAYACPMDPEITSDKPDKCSKCGMDLEKKDNTKNDSVKK